MWTSANSVLIDGWALKLIVLLHALPSLSVGAGLCLLVKGWCRLRKRLHLPADD